jgi:hypothetical protein
MHFEPTVVPVQLMSDHSGPGLPLQDPAAAEATAAAGA